MDCKLSRLSDYSEFLVPIDQGPKITRSKNQTRLSLILIYLRGVCVKLITCGSLGAKMQIFVWMRRLSQSGTARELVASDLNLHMQEVSRARFTKEYFHDIPTRKKDISAICQ